MRVNVRKCVTVVYYVHRIAFHSPFRKARDKEPETVIPEVYTLILVSVFVNFESVSSIRSLLMITVDWTVRHALNVCRY